MHYAFRWIANAWAAEDLRPADAILQDLIAAFWRGEFETAGKGGAPATVLRAEAFSTVRHKLDDLSFVGRPIGRASLLETLCITGAMPDCGIGKANPLAPERFQRAVMRILAKDPAAIEEAYQQLAPLSRDRYPPEGREFIDNLAVDRSGLEAWLLTHGTSAPALLARLGGGEARSPRPARPDVQDVPAPFPPPRVSLWQALCWLAFDRAEEPDDVHQGDFGPHPGAEQRFANAVTLLHSALCAGQLEAWGRRAGNPVIEKVPVHFWETGTLDVLGEAGGAAHPSEAEFDDGRHVYVGLRFQRSDLEALMPIRAARETKPGEARLTIDQIARRWHAETKMPGVSVEDVRDLLLDAAKNGDFQFDPPKRVLADGRADVERDEHGRAPGNYDPRLNKLVETFDERGVPIQAVFIARHLSLKSGDVRRTTALAVRLSLTGLRAWCDGEGFAAASRLHGLKRPAFVEQILLKVEPPQADAPGPNVPGGGSVPAFVGIGKPRPAGVDRQDIAADDELGRRIVEVLEAFRTIYRRRLPNNPPPFGQAAEKLCHDKKNQGFKVVTVRQILNGTYGPARARGIKGALKK